MQLEGEGGQTAAVVAPGAGQRRQAGDGAVGVGAVGVVLHADHEADGGRPRRGVGAGQGGDLFLRHAGDGGYAFQRVVGQPLAEVGEAVRVVDDVVGVEETFVADDAHHAQRQRGVGARPRLDVPVGGGGGARGQGVDDDDGGAVRLRLTHLRPEVEIGDDRVAAPDDDEAAVLEVVRQHAGGVPLMAR